MAARSTRTAGGPRRALADDHRRRLRLAQLRRVLRIGEEREIAGARLLDAGDARDVDVAVAFEPALEPLRDVL